MDKENMIHISWHNTKLGASIPSVNLPPVLTCRPDAPCYKNCYARKGRFTFGRNKDLLQKNLEIYKADPVNFMRQVQEAAKFVQYFRWHSAGDIPDEDYFAWMAAIAVNVPDTQFLAFTKRFEIVNKWLEFFQLPDNLHVVFSAWGDFMPENPHNLPVAYVRLKNCECHIPEDAHECPKYCGDCVGTGCSCWELKNGESVVFNQH